MDYVLGFAFDKEAHKVVLIEKKRPHWQYGSFNGLGGKMDTNEPVEEAMAREFNEEAGVILIRKHWDCFGVMKFPTDKVYLLRAFHDMSMYARTKTDEKVGIFDVVDVMTGKIPIIPNLRILIPMATDRNHVFVDMLMK